MFERFTESARRALFFARYESSQLGAASIEAEHLLLGLVRGNESAPREMLGVAGVSLEGIGQQVERRVPRLATIPTSVEIPFTPVAVRILEFAREEADRLRHNHIGTEHILLGLLREPDSLAFAVLTESGVRLDDARDALVRMLGTSERVSVSGCHGLRGGPDQGSRAPACRCGAVQRRGVGPRGTDQCRSRLPQATLLT